jgi:hypothetical protein
LGSIKELGEKGIRLFRSCTACRVVLAASGDACVDISDNYLGGGSAPEEDAFDYS